MASEYEPENLEEFEDALEDAHGIGPKTMRRLAHRFGDVDAMCRADDREIATAVGNPRRPADRRGIQALKAVDMLRGARGIRPDEDDGDGEDEEVA